ncbi:Thymus-specific serine protease [Chamberlinius hualienensis]
MSIVCFFLLILVSYLTEVSASFINPFRLQFRVISNPSTNEIQDHPPAQWFTQRLDHFNAADTRTWSQRYYVSDSYYTNGGPAFLMLGSEAPAEPKWMVKGQWVHWAKDFHAMCFYLEHRYYGESHPTEDTSVKNLQYLSSEQAIADAATFRTFIAERHGLENATWIAFGGSYAGSLAVWLRLKYPHLIDGAVASSAPLLAKTNFKELLKTVTKSFTIASNSCATAMASGIQQMEDLVGQGNDGWSNLTEKFRLCNQLNGSKQADVNNLFNVISGGIAGIVQYNNDGQSFEKFSPKYLALEKVCEIMNVSAVPEIDRLARVVSLILTAKDFDCMFHSYSPMIHYLRHFEWDSSTVTKGSRQWMYQSCAEFGWHKSSDFPYQPFGNKFPVSFFLNQCAHVFGPKFNSTLMESNVRETNINYGGKGIRVTKVVLFNGSLDPWHSLSVTHDINNETKSIFVQGASHCADMTESRSTDSNELIQARETIRAEIAKWLV